jgi:hypothetical protein
MKRIISLIVLLIVFTCLKAQYTYTIKADSVILVSDTNGNLFYRDASTLAAHDWPDYVFGDTYTLPSPDSLRSYIKKNNHLPGVPAAAEADRKGIDVGDNQAILLKKIEELTLYMLKQEERIKALEQQVHRQNETIDKTKQTR